ncbi:MAG: NAD(P)-dependent oxidoreductase [Rubrivivax sp.]|nr:NAD(P)-dependent oxidoreductase [Rubrivivax sp.]
MAPHTPIRFRRLLLTGAAGYLGGVLRPRLKAYCDTLRLSDRRPLGPAAPGEELVVAELDDAAAMLNLLAGVDAIVHLGGISVEAAWQPILAANIDGLFKLYEAARHHGVKRVVFASSNHVTGFYRQDEVITPQHMPKPDTLYGLSKAFGENLAQLYWHRHGIQTVSIRIGSSTAEVADRRMLATWLSHDDLEQLVLRALTAPVVGHTVVYGLSDNGTRWWDNTSAAHLGYRPQDSSELQRARVEAQQPVLDPNDPHVMYQGGRFVTLGPFDA